jgi:hypothetical protein
MGTAFSVDTPLRVARYGISSVISLVDDVLIEQMRKFHCKSEGEPYEEIANHDEDARARRITAYLNLMDRLVQRQTKALWSSPFDESSEITRYYEMLPETPHKRAYRDMLATTDPVERARMQDELHRLAVPGSIDVNIMAKVDRDLYRDGEKLPPAFSAAMAALRGYANSTLRSSVIFSAGMNPRLYSYAAQFADFLPDEKGLLQKMIVLKVSDFRSALIQGKFLARRGLWVSEYRIESGLNCGGHAFVTDGHLMGPILEEFKQKRLELVETLHSVYNQALAARGRSRLKVPQEVRITAQGGIGTASENELLLKYYHVDGTGWGTPFLLVPEVTNVDDTHLTKLAAATDDDVYLSDASPFGVPFWNLRTSASEEARRRRIAGGHPGSPCPKGILVSNTEFTTAPICTASHAYQKRKLEHLPEEGFSASQLPVVQESILSKSCICHDLAGGATIKCGIDSEASSALCCGPGIVDYSRVTTLRVMVDHIYGRSSLKAGNDRPHMFIRELMLYVDYLRSEVRMCSLRLSTHTPESLHEFRNNLLTGIEYYRRLAEPFIEEKRKRFLNDLTRLRKAIEPLASVPGG